MLKTHYIIALMLMSGFYSGVYAQTPPEPAPMTAADLEFEPDEKHTEEFHKYFFFHKTGVSLDQALNDIGECYVYRKGPIGKEGQVMNIVPRFVSLSENQSYKPYVYNPNDGGAVGAIIGDIVGASILKKAKAQRLRKCMEYKSYDRYGLSKELWKKISDVSQDDYVKINAHIASGPQPTTKKLLP